MFDHADNASTIPRLVLEEKFSPVKVPSVPQTPSQDASQLSRQVSSPFLSIPTLPFNVSQRRYKPQEFEIKQSAESSGTKTYRFLDRGMAFEQSFGHVNLFKAIGSRLGKELRALYYRDLFHSFLNLRLRFQVLVMAFLLLMMWTISAVAILLIREPCGLDGVQNFLDAFFFSVETLETIGFGVPGQIDDPNPWYFNQCVSGAVFLSVESIVTVAFRSLVVGLLFTRISKPQSRAATLVFSSRALIQFDREGAPYFVFRVADLCRDQLIAGHIRCYCIKNRKEVGTVTEYTGLQVYPMRLNEPDDELGGKLMLSAPQYVLHRIDMCSPLSPYFKPLVLHKKPTNQNDAMHNISNGIASRMGEADMGSRVGYICEVCGCEFHSTYSLKLHIHASRHDNSTNLYEEPSAAQLKVHWGKDGESFEIVCICEGIEPFTSSTLQARHSYTSSGDILFGRRFVSCIHSDMNDEIRIDSIESCSAWTNSIRRSH